MPKKQGNSVRIKIALQQRTLYRFSLLAARQARCLARMYTQKFGLSVARWKVLAIIGHYAPMSAKEVAARTSLEPEKVTRAVDGLVLQRLVIRRRDPSDKRRVILTLSAKGRDIYNESEVIRRAIDKEFLEVLRPDERQMFYVILDKLERRAADIFSGPQAWREILARQETGAKAKPNGRGATTVAA